MKVQLSFELPDESEEYKITYNANKYYRSLTDILELLRSKVKYQDLPKKEFDIVSALQKDILEILTDNEVELWT